jgi:ribosomal protein S19E (S16A)
METQALSLSPSEKLTLKHLSEGELHTEHLDWVALQRLKRLGLVEDRNSGPALTQEGRRALQRLLAGA